MPIIAIEELVPLLDGRRRLLGLDVGSKTVGLAISDALGMAATPLETLRRGKFQPDAQRLFAFAASREVAAFIVGLPINMDGEEGPRCQSVRQFAANLLAVQDAPIVFWDERMSTQAVTRVMLDADLSRRRRAELVDKAAAAYILQGALDRLRVLKAQATLAAADAPEVAPQEMP